MALVKCPKCGKTISNSAHRCPNCGFSPHKAGLKVLLFIGVILLCFLIIGFYNWKGYKDSEKGQLEDAHQEQLESKLVAKQEFEHKKQIEQAKKAEEERLEKERSKAERLEEERLREEKREKERQEQLEAEKKAKGPAWLQGGRWIHTFIDPTMVELVYKIFEFNNGEYKFVQSTSEYASPRDSRSCQYKVENNVIYNNNSPLLIIDEENQVLISYSSQDEKYFKEKIVISN